MMLNTKTRSPSLPASEPYYYPITASTFPVTNQKKPKKTKETRPQDPFAYHL